MDPLHFTIIQSLQRVTFLPASFDKRFARDMGTLGAYDMLSPKQAALLEKMAWRYRRQIGRALVPKPNAPPKEPSAEELRKLKDWNEGKPL